LNLRLVATSPRPSPFELPPKDAPIDSVGAGDAFVAGYIAELLQGLDVPARLVTALKAGTFAYLVGRHAADGRSSDFLEAEEPVLR
jgi:2-dehydro-3-deoxygluconokinase